MKIIVHAGDDPLTCQRPKQMSTASPAILSNVWTSLFNPESKITRLLYWLLTNVSRLNDDLYNGLQHKSKVSFPIKIEFSIHLRIYNNYLNKNLIVP